MKVCSTVGCKSTDIVCGFSLASVKNYYCINHKDIPYYIMRSIITYYEYMERNDMLSDKDKNKLSYIKTLRDKYKNICQQDTPSENSHTTE